MLRIVIIGGTGHVGTYLVPRLVHSGHQVLCISRGESKPYRNHPAWESVEHVRLDRDAEEAAGDFAQRVRSLRPDVVIDMICFELESARQLVEALRGHVHHLLHCGTIWVHGHSMQVPTTEDQPAILSASMAPRRHRSKTTCSTKPAATAFRQRSCTRAISWGPAGSP
jgi:nucleoside-diphosphate-sugar epimerase